MQAMTEGSRSTGTVNLNKLALVAVLSVGAMVASGGLSIAALGAFKDERSAGVYVALFTTLSAVFTLALVPMARRAGAPFAPYVVAVSLAAQWLLPAFSAILKLGDPLITSHWRCGTGDVAFVIIGPMVASGAGLFAVILSRFVVPRIGVRSARALRVLATLKLMGAVAIVAIGAWRLSALPQANAYLDRMPVIGTLPALSPAPHIAEQIDTVGPLLFWRGCENERGCHVGMRSRIQNSESMHFGELSVGTEAMRVRYDARAHIAVLETVTQSAWPRRIAFNTETRGAIDVTYHTLQGRVAPPSLWFATAVVGLLLALAAFARGASSTRELLQWRSARPATLSPEGTLTFSEDRPAARVQGDARVPVGPVLVLEESSAAHPREMSTVPASALRAGTLSDIETDIARAEGGRYVLAAVVAGWTVSPLALALWYLQAR